MSTVDEKWIRERLEERSAAGNLRELRTYDEGIDFCSNDYLGWAKSKVIDERANEILKLFPASHSGSTGSRLITGHSNLADELEKKIAAYHGCEAALFFSNGFMANLGLISAIADRHTTLIMDEYCHASMIDGARLSMASHVYKFNHNDLDDLEKKLSAASGRKIVLVENVYSMDGDQSPLDAVVRRAAAHQRLPERAIRAINRNSTDQHAPTNCRSAAANRRRACVHHRAAADRRACDHRRAAADRRACYCAATCAGLSA